MCTRPWSPVLTPTGSGDCVLVLPLGLSLPTCKTGMTELCAGLDARAQTKHKAGPVTGTREI